MDYVVGGVAALISGNVTPNRPKLVRRALTPMKHQPSPNVTPKSEYVDDRSIFLSPTLQKKKAIVKKSPKRIFQNADMDVTSENENGSNPTSPVADKVKKHLNDELEAGSGSNNNQKTPKKKSNKSTESTPKISPKFESPQSANENTPKKQKKRKSSDEGNTSNLEKVNSGKTKKNKKLFQSENIVSSQEHDNEIVSNEQSPIKKKKKSLNPEENVESENIAMISKSLNDDTNINKSPKKKNKKRKNKKGNNKIQNYIQEENKNEDKTAAPSSTKKDKSKKHLKNVVNPNAVTDKDSDSEHESDNEIVSENEEANKEILDTGPVAEDSSDEEEESPEAKKVEKKEKKVEPRSEDEVKRTLFVGNVPFSKKCKKEIKKIFSKYGVIQTVRIRTVPIKDARSTPKLAVIKNELHPERTTVNVYVKFKDPASVEQALVENNTILNNCHLRVTRSESTGAEHDPRCSVFVGNVPFALEDETLREKFEKCGNIVSVRIIRDKKTNAGKGFAYVNFESKDGVELALALSEEDLTIKNRILRVKRCTQNANRQKNQESGKGFLGKNQGQNVQNNRFGKKGGTFKQKGQAEDGQGEGAFRRIMHKRKNQDGSDGPPNKMQKNINQPHKEKKVRKEFVGMTAEKKKKHTFSKGQKKKKALSEILTKHS